MIEHLKSSHGFPRITSFNTAQKPSRWDLGKEGLCCRSPGSGEDGQGIYICVSMYSSKYVNIHIYIYLYIYIYIYIHEFRIDNTGGGPFSYIQL